MAEETARCQAHPQMAQLLSTRYHESKVGGGISVDGTMLEIFGGENGSFTVTKTLPTGLTCIIDLGVGWQTKLPSLTGDEGAVGPDESEIEH